MSEEAATIPPPAPAAEPAPLRSVHTPNFPRLLTELGISLVVSTYQAGRLVIFRAEGEQINTLFRAFNKPMGVAVAPKRLAVGTTSAIWEFRDVPAVAAKIEPVGTHDACFMPRTIHFTGDVQMHEMAWSGDELWFVNTRFSCLCTRSSTYNFVPRWRPSFISALAPEDRCHLNGLGMMDGKPRYATALGRTDTPAGWRENKKDGGVLIDIDSNEVIVAGLSMPHSPRWHNGQLWVLDSGSGSIGVVDRRTGRYQPIAEMPGFTRGLDFHGRYAFIGLSQVRESAVFSGISLTERLSESERICGVWVVDTFRQDGRLSPLRGCGAGDLRRAGLARPALSRPHQRRCGDHGQFVRLARRQPGRSRRPVSRDHYEIGRCERRRAARRRSGRAARAARRCKLASGTRRPPVSRHPPAGLHPMPVNEAKVSGMRPAGRERPAYTSGSRVNPAG